MTLTWLINGAIGGAVVSLIAFALSRFLHDLAGRIWLATVLVAAACFYLVFAADAHASPAWLAAEIVGIVVYGAMALIGIRRSPWWLAAGWALHPLWDMILHYFGSGRSFTPEAYPISCVSWDLLVASYIAIAYGAGLIGTRGLPAAAASADPSTCVAVNSSTAAGVHGPGTVSGRKRRRSDPRSDLLEG